MGHSARALVHATHQLTDQLRVSRRSLAGGEATSSGGGRDKPHGPYARCADVGAMRPLLRIAAAILLVACTPVRADQLDERGIQGIHDSGIHVGRAIWAVRNCNIRSTDQLEVMRKSGLRAHAQSFERGLEVGATEALQVEKNSSRKKGCTISYIMYGKNGMVAAGLLEWEGPVQGR
jgi:hypothetical protein